MYDNELIFGKDKTERIVNVEMDGDGFLTIFKQDEVGRIKQEMRQVPFWFLTDRKVSSAQRKLYGGQHYDWIAEFEEKSHYLSARSKCKARQVDTYCIWDDKEAALVRNGITYFKGLKPKEISILSFDIESSGILRNKDSRVYIISNTFRTSLGKIERKLFFCDDYENDADMFDDWCAWVRDKDPSIMCGHNIFGYDLPFMCHVANKAGTDLYLGRDGSSLKFRDYPSKFRKDGSQSYEYHNAMIYGREVVDTMFLSIKYDIGRKYESYGLKQIVRQEGLEKPGRTFVDAAKIREYYENRIKDVDTWENVMRYASEDGDDALTLFDLMAPSFFYFTQSVSKTFQQMINTATGSQINNIMVRSYLQKDGSVARASEAVSYEGAISFGIPGIYKNCFKQDVASLYPSIMLEYQVYDKHKDPKKHFLNMLEHFTVERLKNKELAQKTGDQYYTDLEQTAKVGINSMYGFLGAQGLNYNSCYKAAFVTQKGREILSKAIEFATGKDVAYWKNKADNEEEIESAI